MNETKSEKYIEVSHRVDPHQYHKLPDVEKSGKLMSTSKAIKYLNQKPTRFTLNKKIFQQLIKEGRIFPEKTIPFKKWRQSRLDQYAKESGIFD